MSTNFSSYQSLIEVKTPKGFKLISTRDILYIKAVRKCSIVYLNESDNIITFHLLRWFENYLLEPFFFRCHNSYLVNCQFVDYYCRKEITLKNKNKIPLSRNSFEFFKENLKCLLIEL
jgi:two-component system, LytTR family, response regulator